MRTLLQLCQTLMEWGGSDLHLTTGSPPRIRVNGQLRALDGPPLTEQETEQLVSEILTQGQQRRKEDKNEVDCSFGLAGIGRFRCHAYKQRGSAAAAIRAIPFQIPTFEELGLPPTILELISKPQGLLLVTGPTGSGKSTTLAAMVNHINEKRSAHIVTIEDPIEYLHPHKSSLVNQREIGTDTESFQAGLKFVLRQDPDVVLLGELRDVETIHTAMTVAETGHLTLSTLHTNSAAQTIHRVILAHPPHQQAGVRTQLSMILEGILSQRLVPNLTGKGRVLALEILVPTPAIRNLIREDKIHQIYSMMQTGQAKHGMQTMNQSLVDLFKQQLISAQSAMAFSSYPEELVGLLERAKGAETSRSSLMQIRTHR